MPPLMRNEAVYEDPYPIVDPVVDPVALVPLVPVNFYVPELGCLIPTP